MKTKSVDGLILVGILVAILYQYTILYFSIVEGAWHSFPLVVLATIGGLVLGRSAYWVLSGALVLVCLSVGGVLLMVTATRASFFWPAVALMTVTPGATYLMYRFDHYVLKRQAVVRRLAELKLSHPEMDLVTGALSRETLATTLQQQLPLVTTEQPLTLTLVKIDFLENIVNFIGTGRLNQLLRITAGRLETLCQATDRLYYVGAGRFVIASLRPRHGLKRGAKRQAVEIANEAGLTSDALILRIGRATYQAPDNVAIADVLDALDRSAETDIAREYL